LLKIMGGFNMATDMEKIFLPSEIFPEEALS
jgi:hypothetical protein